MTQNPKLKCYVNHIYLSNYSIHYRESEAMDNREKLSVYIYIESDIQCVCQTNYSISRKKQILITSKKCMCLYLYIKLLSK